MHNSILLAGQKCFLYVQGPILICFFHIKWCFNERIKLKNKILGFAGQIKSLGGHILPAGRVLCMSDIKDYQLQLWCQTNSKESNSIFKSSRFHHQKTSLDRCSSIRCCPWKEDQKNGFVRQPYKRNLSLKNKLSIKFFEGEFLIWWLHYSIIVI